jgi:hypothetical protein
MRRFLLPHRKMRNNLRGDHVLVLKVWEVLVILFGAFLGAESEIYTLNENYGYESR